MRPIEIPPRREKRRGKEEEKKRQGIFMRRSSNLLFLLMEFSSKPTAYICASSGPGPLVSDLLFQEACVCVCVCVCVVRERERDYNYFLAPFFFCGLSDTEQLISCSPEVCVFRHLLPSFPYSVKGPALQ